MKEQTKDIGFAKVYQKIKSLGAMEISENKFGNKHTIVFTSPNGRVYHISTRAKSRGTWQTSTNYGRFCHEKIDENEYWVFVDLSSVSCGFYIVPKWWVQNDIAHHHEEYLKKHDGRRPGNDFSKHHAIHERRIIQWENKWQLIGL